MRFSYLVIHMKKKIVIVFSLFPPHQLLQWLPHSNRNDFELQKEEINQVIFCCSYFLFRVQNLFEIPYYSLQLIVFSCEIGEVIELWS